MRICSLLLIALALNACSSPTEYDDENSATRDYAENYDQPASPVVSMEIRASYDSLLPRFTMVMDDRYNNYCHVNWNGSFSQDRYAVTVAVRRNVFEPILILSWPTTFTVPEDFWNLEVRIGENYFLTQEGPRIYPQAENSAEFSGTVTSNIIREIAASTNEEIIINFRERSGAEHLFTLAQSDKEAIHDCQTLIELQMRAYQNNISL